jgi:hypothetical protein
MGGISPIVLVILPFVGVAHAVKLGVTKTNEKIDETVTELKDPRHKLNKAIEVDTFNPILFLQRGIISLAVDDNEKAKQDLTFANKHAPNNYQMFDFMAHNHVQSIFLSCCGRSIQSF